MSLTAIVDQLLTINEKIVGVRRAFARPPQTLSDADIPAIAVLWRNTDVLASDPYMEGRKLHHHFALRLYGPGLGQDTGHASRQERIEPFFERILDAYDAALLLNELDASRYESLITAVRYTTIGQYQVMEFELTVKEKYAVTVDV